MKEIHPALKPATDTKFIQLRTVPERLHRELKSQAAFNGTTIEQHIVNILENYICDQSAKASK